MNSLQRFAPYGVLVLAVALVFGQAVDFEFVQWDDPLHITQNPFYLPLTPRSFLRLMATAYFGLYIPVSYAFWGALSVVSQMITPADGVRFDPRVYHGANVLLHAACGAFVYQIVVQLVASRWAACLGTLVFLLHPLQVESVCWVSEARGLLAAVFSLAALALVIKHSGPSPERVAGQPAERHSLATGLFLLAILSKPSAVTLPLVLVVLLHLAFGTAWRKLLQDFWDWFFLAGVGVLITRFVQPTGEVLPPTALWQRPLVVGDALTFYLGKLFWPVGLAMDYGRTPTMVLAQPDTLYLWLIPTAAFAGAWWLGRAAAVRAGLAMFLLAPLPVLGLLPFQYQRISTVADRYLYVSFAGVALIVAFAVVRGGRAVTVVTMVVVALLGWQSWRQSQTWHDSIVLFEHALSINPRSIPALNNLGVLAQQRGATADAGAYFQRALAVDPQHADANTGMGTVFLAQDKLPEALEHFERALAKTPWLDRPNAGAASVYHRLGNTRLAAKYYPRSLAPDTRRAAPTLTPAETAVAANQFARILATDRDDTLRDGKLAVQWASHAVTLSRSRSSGALDTLAAALAESGDFERAMQAENRALALAQAAGNVERTARLRTHLERFEAHQPLRETPAEQLAQ